MKELDESARERIEAFARPLDPDPAHSHQVARLSLLLFDGLRGVHGLKGRDRPLLEAAALLHDVGWSRGGKGHHKHAYDLIRRGEDLPFPEEDRNLVAAVARYHRKALPRARHRAMRDLSPKDRRRVRWLAALLRVADGLDVEHRGRVQGLRCRFRDGVPLLEVRSEEPPEAALRAADRKADLFRRLHERNLVMRWKP